MKYGHEFPQDPKKQVMASTEAVFRSWNDLKEGVIIFDENDETYKLNTDKVFSTPEKATTYISGNDEDIHLDMWYDEQETPLNEIINCIQKLNS